MRRFFNEIRCAGEIACGGEIRCAGEIACGGEIRCADEDGEGADFISTRRSRDFTRMAQHENFNARKRDFTVAKLRAICYIGYGVIAMADNKLSERSMDFAVEVLKLCDAIKGHYSLVNQLERSATSIGANLREANYAHSRADFIAKLQIALKECYEAEYWLELLLRAGYAAEESISPLLHECGSIRRMLVSSVNTAKKNQSIGKK